MIEIFVQCDECGKAFAIENLFMRHKFRHTGLKPFSCELCTKSFAFKAMIANCIKNITPPTFLSKRIQVHHATDAKMKLTASLFCFAYMSWPKQVHLLPGPGMYISIDWLFNVYDYKTLLLA